MDVELQEKMVNETVNAVMAPLSVLKEKRGGNFVISDSKPYVDAVNDMGPGEGQEGIIYDLFQGSVNAHYDILKDLTDTIEPKDDPFVEHYQTPVLLEILYDELPEFRKSVDKFIDGIDGKAAELGKYAVKRYGGMYGPNCVVDFGMSSGSHSAAMNRVLKDMDLEHEHAEAILASKSWGMNTSYGFGAAFSAFIVSQVVFQTPIGRWSDIYGRKPFLVGGLLLLAPTTLVQGYVFTTLQLVVARFMQGIAGAMFFAPAFALAGDNAHRSTAGGQMSLLTIGFGLGTAMGPLVSGVLVGVSFQTPFAFGFLVSLLSATLVWKDVSETVPERPEA